MAEYTRLEFMALSGGMRSNHLSTAISRKNVKPIKKRGGKEMTFDAADPVNALWLAKKSSSGKPPISLEEQMEKYGGGKTPKVASKVTENTHPVLIPASNKPPVIPLSVEKTSQNLDSMSLTDLEVAKKKADLLRVQKGLELDEIKIQKQRGEVVPIDLVVSVIARLRKTMAVSYKELAEKLVTDLCSELGSDRELMSRYRGQIIKDINSNEEETEEIFLLDIESIVNDYSISRAAGERI